MIDIEALQKCSRIGKEVLSFEIATCPVVVKVSLSKHISFENSIVYSLQAAYLRIYELEQKLKTVEEDKEFLKKILNKD